VRNGWNETGALAGRERAYSVIIADVDAGGVFTKKLLLLLAAIFSLTVLLAACRSGKKDEKSSAPPVAPNEEKKRLWELVDGNGVYGINKDFTKSALYPQLTVFNGRLFAAWSEWNGDANQVRVADYDGASWKFADGDGTEGLNRDVTRTALTPHLAAFNNKLYVIWSEWDSTGSISRIRAAVYDGTSWQFIDGGRSAGLNRDVTRDAFDPQLTVFNNRLYAAWSEFNGAAYQIHVAVYNGTSWEYADGEGADGINADVEKDALSPQLSVFNNRLYAAWSESNGAGHRIRVAVFSGTSWSLVDGVGTGGINRLVSGDALTPQLTVFNNRLYAAWAESDGAAYQVRVAAFNGTSWLFVDGNTSDGINKDPSKDAFTPQLTVFNNRLYAAWSELNDAANQIRLAAYDGASWVFVDEDGDDGINVYPLMGAFNPQLAEFNNRLYVTWNEWDAVNSINQIRVAVSP
jgi:hypothetical protein